MLKAKWVWVGVVIALFAACTASTAPPDPTAQLEVVETIAATAQPEATETVAPEPTATPAGATSVPDAPTLAPTEASEEVGLQPRPHRDAPAPTNAFVSDSAAFVGQTGAPQLVEFFTFW